MDTKQRFFFIGCFSLGILGLALSWMQASEWGKAGSVFILLLAQRFVVPAHAFRRK